MATLADSLISSSARPLSVRIRPDLQVTKQRYQGRQYWIIKDPVGLNYFRFQEEEFALLNWLDGKSSLDDLRTKFEKQFAPQKITLEELGRLIGMLHQSGLVIAAMPGQGKQLLKRRWDRKKKEMLGALSNILAIRFKGIDPERILTWMNPRFGWIFTKPAFIIWLLTFLAALSLVLVQFDEFQRKLPTFHRFFGPENWMVLAIAMGLTKVLHEFGHGLSCKHFGGECHEMGVMVLVLTPCLYCNVSDSWMLPNKWHRAFIGAAGMYVEIFLASIATFIWWFSQPNTTLNNVCLSTMFVCSVSTVVFNGNPLLRYDGYYILSDILEIPNLRQKATTILTRKLGSWCLGLEEQDDPFLPKRNQFLFAIYSVAASVYSWVVVFSILFFLYKVFKPHRLEIFGQIIAAMSLISLVVRPLWKLGKFFYVPGRTDQVKKPRLFATLALVFAAIGVVVFFPFPYRVYCTFEVQPAGAEHVYVKTEGELTDVPVKAGQNVETGMLLAQLRNVDLELQLADLESHREQELVRLDTLRHQRQLDASAQLEIPRVEKSLKTIDQQLAERKEDIEKLKLIAKSDGVIIPPPATPDKPSPDGRLPKWHGTPLEERNLNSTLATGTMFCQIGDPTKFEAILVIDQAEIEMIRKGQRVEMMLAEMPGERLEGVVNAIAPEEMKVAPRPLSHEAGGDLQTKTDATGIQRPASTSYQVEVPLDNPNRMLVSGLKGEARIETGRHSLGWRLWRFLKQTFHFRM